MLPASDVGNYDALTMNFALEDNFEDVLGKARRGLGIEEDALAKAAGIDRRSLDAVMGGAFDLDVVRAVSAPLGLAADRVVALGERTYVPEPIALEGLLQFNTAFDDMMVNAFLVWDPVRRKAAVFDTGSDVGDLLAAAEERDLEIQQVFITHSHGDHIFDLDRLLEKTGVGARTPSGEPVDGAEAFEVGETFEVGDLRIESRLTWGHAKAGVTYVVKGLDRPVAICGDALFAGSMGGGMVSFEAALATNRGEIFSLSDNTVLCPGHGPMTSVGEQRRCNPFFPEEPKDS